MITRSVSAGPYAAPPAAGPSTTEICGTRPDARTIAANTRPTASSASTPSASRAPPECQRPTPGPARARAVSMASTMCRQPSAPIAPPIDGGVGAYAIDRGAVDRAARGEHAAAVAGSCSGRMRPGVEAALAAGLGIARVASVDRGSVGRVRPRSRSRHEASACGLAEGGLAWDRPVRRCARRSRTSRSARR